MLQKDKGLIILFNSPLIRIACGSRSGYACQSSLLAYYLTYFSNVLKESFSAFLIDNDALIWTWENGNAFGALKSWKENPLWISAASVKEEGGAQHVHGWENITLVEEETKLANKLLPSIHF